MWFSNSDYFPKQHSPVGLCNGDAMCFLWGTNWILKNIINIHFRLHYLMPDYRLEVSLHPESPATRHFNEGFPWFSSVLQQMLSWYPNSTLHCMLHMQPSQMVTSKFRPNATLPMLVQISLQYSSSNAILKLIPIPVIQFILLRLRSLSHAPSPPEIHSTSIFRHLFQSLGSCCGKPEIHTVWPNDATRHKGVTWRWHQVLRWRSLRVIKRIRRTNTSG
jgi:hypothetical protein